MKKRKRTALEDVEESEGVESDSVLCNESKKRDRDDSEPPMESSEDLSKRKLKKVPRFSIISFIYSPFINTYILVPLSLLLPPQVSSFSTEFLIE